MISYHYGLSSFCLVTSERFGPSEGLYEVARECVIWLVYLTSLWGEKSLMKWDCQAVEKLVGNCFIFLGAIIAAGDMTARFQGNVCT